MLQKVQHRRKVDVPGIALRAAFCSNFALSADTDAIENYNKSIDICKRTGRLHLAATNMKQVAELCEEEIGNKEEATNAFLLAASWYQAEDSNAQANSCILRAAHLEADLGKYKEAVEHFEEVIENSKSNRLSRFSLREYFFKASLCRMCCGDYEGACAAALEYKRIDNTYSDTRECEFIDVRMVLFPPPVQRKLTFTPLTKKMLEIAIESRDLEQFTQVVSSWDQITRLDAWKTNLLLVIKNNLSEVDFT